VIVKIEDQFGNVVTSDNSDVTLFVESGPGGASIGGTLTVAAVNGIATFSGLTINTAGSYLLSADDGELAAGSSNNFVIQAGSASTLVIAEEPTSVTAGTAVGPIVVAIEDGFGNIITANNSTIELMVQTGPSASPLFAAASNGTASFTENLNTAGTYKLRAIDGTLHQAATPKFTVSPGSPTQLVFVSQPSSATAGVAFSPDISVDVEDSYDNIVTNYTAKIAVATATGPGAISGTSTLHAVNGVATFPGLFLTTAGTYTLSATHTGLTTATSAPITVNPGAASQLVFTGQPANVTAGTRFLSNIVAQAEDSYGNLATSYNSNVTLGSKVVPPDNVNFTPVTATAVNGIATFTPSQIQILDVAGGYRLKVTQSGLSPGISAKFYVEPAAAEKLAFVQQPTSVTAGNPISPPVSVQVEDAFGNLVSDSPVMLSVGPNSPDAVLGGVITVNSNNGVAVFSDVLLDTTGSYKLMASDPGASSANSTRFAVNPA